MRSSLPWGALLAFATGCSGCAPSAPPTNDASADAATDVADAKDEPKPCTPKPRPSFVPAGWRPLDEYRPCSGLYVPTKVEELPPPPVWESCGADVDPPVAGCERIAIDPLSKGYIGSTDASLDGAGNVLLLMSRDYVDHQLLFVADATGRVYSAAMAAQMKDYALAAELLQSIYAPRWILTVADISAKRSDGFVVGSTVAVAPTASWHRDFGASTSEIIGPPGIVHMENNANLQLLDFDDPYKKILDIITVAQSSGIPNSFLMWHGSSLYWFGNSGRLAIQRRWDADTGPVDFINYGDPNHGAGDLGTDGKDMVWVESHGPEIKNALWTTADYWTSPYVKDKKDLKPRRLRSEVPNVLFGIHTKVGCGRAALNNGAGLRVIDVESGNSWFLPNSSKTGWGWIEPLVLTCEYLYARVGFSGPNTSIGRFPFTSLGAPDPPD